MRSLQRWEVCLCFQGPTHLSHGCFPSCDVPVLDYLPWVWEHDDKQTLRHSQLEFSCSVILSSVWTSSACQHQTPACLLGRAELGRCQAGLTFGQRMIQTLCVGDSCPSASPVCHHMCNSLGRATARGRLLGDNLCC